MESGEGEPCGVGRQPLSTGKGSATVEGEHCNIIWLSMLFCMWCRQRPSPRNRHADGGYPAGLAPAAMAVPVTCVTSRARGRRVCNKSEGAGRESYSEGYEGSVALALLQYSTSGTVQYSTVQYARADCAVHYCTAAGA